MDFREEQMVDNTEKLLFAILQELRKLNRGDIPEPEIEVQEEKPKKKNCRYCGGSHDSKAESSECYRQYRKEGGT